MGIDYKQLEALVKEAMFTQGGINEPSAPEGIPHRMPAADNDAKKMPVGKGDEAANALYDIALRAREATEQLIEKLDEPIYDGAYEHAFKATSSLRRVLNALEEAGAWAMPQQRVVAPPRENQPYSGYVPYTPFSGMPGGSSGEDINEFVEPGDGDGTETVQKLGSGGISRSTQARSLKDRGMNVGTGASLEGVDNRERKMLQQVEAILTDIAEKDDLLSYRAWFQTVLKTLLKKMETRMQSQLNGEEENENQP
jgi:hypothetical protein